MGTHGAKDPCDALLPRLILELNHLRDLLNKASLTLKDLQFSSDADKRDEVAQLAQALLERAKSESSKPPDRTGGS